MALATLAGLNADILYMIADELAHIPNERSPSHRAIRSQKRLLKIIYLNKNTYNSLRNRLYRNIHVSTTRSLALLVRTLLTRRDLRGLPRIIISVPRWGLKVSDMDESLWAEMTRSIRESCLPGTSLVLDAIAKSAKDDGQGRRVPVSSLFMAAVYLTRNLQSVSVSQPLVTGIESEWLAELVASIQQLDPSSRRLPVYHFELVMKKYGPPISLDFVVDMVGAVDNLVFDFGRNDNFLAMKLPVLNSPNQAWFKMTTPRKAITHWKYIYTISCQLPNLLRAYPGLKELWLRQPLWPKEMARGLQNCQETLETFRLDIQGPSDSYPMPGLPQLLRLEHLTVDAGLLWPELLKGDHPLRGNDTPLDANLPPSLRSLRVAYGWVEERSWSAPVVRCDARISADLVGFLDAVPQRFPCFEELGYRHKGLSELCLGHHDGPDFIEDIAAACDQKGIRFISNWDNATYTPPIFDLHSF
ncbi:hypothetical protein PG995_014154 [Apiospora arundinis]